ncbi:SDR family oxidoreductase [Candidatus Formimonas warabiya]|uniref:3-oxoacyl-ACP reductase n=1 Tax=Formimonas warabiya TaxID=1761012 RepID=A0A3G1KYM3_FORW1|nr:SDR family oxidoreductase [Candidatus Formimonas warabiya]ATW27613.1 3-oxoacyl-ACP reductase [Candidatus Formimonas warabiya]
MDLGLKGKSVLVMASSAGLGKAAALEFCAEGAHVMLFSPFPEELREAQKEIKEATGNEPAYTVGDLRKYEDIKAVVKNTAERFGTVHVLVNNAGGPPAGVFDTFDDAAWQDAYDLTLLSYIRAIREVLPYMRQAGEGRILNFASSSVKQVLDNLILSNTFRMGVLGLTKTLSQELGKDHILINVIGPGRIGTARIDYMDRVRAEKAGLTVDQIKASTCKTIPLGRYGFPEEHARLAVYLCSQANTFITGQTILVDGGMVKAY